ncbi:MAG: arginyltransferase [Porticoccaceae bacterium]
MTRDISPDLAKIRLFLTEPHACSYLPDRQATTAFVDPKVDANIDIYNDLSDLGFRRSGRYLYTPRCGSCKACIPIRIDAVDFRPSRQQRKCLNRNADLAVDIVDTIDQEEHYPLYERYISARHQDGDMHPPSRSQYEDFIGRPWQDGTTAFMEFRKDGELLGCAVIDWLRMGASAIYTYFDPAEDRRSLGTFAILQQVEAVLARNLDYVYLGFWIRDSSKMSYKIKFKPAELFINDQWMRLG